MYFNFFNQTFDTFNFLLLSINQYKWQLLHIAQYNQYTKSVDKLSKSINGFKNKSFLSHL